jgi:hypothetical protein
VIRDDQPDAREGQAGRAGLLGENPPASGFGERVPLQGKILIYGRHSGIANQHRFRRDVAHIG